MNVGKLREIIARLPDDMEVLFEDNQQHLWVADAMVVQVCDTGPDGLKIMPDDVVRDAGEDPAALKDKRLAVIVNRE